MSTQSATNIAASVKARLLLIAQDTGLDFQDMLRRYGVERTLYRLSISAHAKKYVLKGAQLFLVWHGEYGRPTADADLLGRGSNNADEMRATWRDICAVTCPEDGLAFDIKAMTVEAIRAGQEYEGLRVKLTLLLERTRIPVQIDIGFGDATTPAPVMCTFPGLLDLPSAWLPAYRPETVVAEKFDAIVKLGLLNTRFKDFHDLWAIAHEFTFDGEALSRALRATFQRRRSSIPATIPIALTPEFYGDAARVQRWKAFTSKGRFRAHDQDFAAVCQFIREFVMPVAETLARGAHFTGTWQPGGPWK